MFSKAKRFDIAAAKPDGKDVKKPEVYKNKPKIHGATPKAGTSTVASSRCTSDVQSESGSVRSAKSAFATPKPKQHIAAKASSCKKEAIATPILRFLKKPALRSEHKKVPNDLATAQEVEIRNKDFTIAEYGQQIEELKNEIALLQNKIKDNSNLEQATHANFDHLNKEIINIISSQGHNKIQCETNQEINSADYDKVIDALQNEIHAQQINNSKLEEELLEKQMELSEMESLIHIRDSLCKDLQDKLSEKESALEKTLQRLEMVNGHHALAMEANESIRREYKQELDCLKSKLDEEKQIIQTKCKNDQEVVKNMYLEQIESLRKTMEQEKHDAVIEIEEKIQQKDVEMKAKLEQVEERAHERLRLCEIQYEQRSQSMQEHCEQQQDQIKILELEMSQLKYSLTVANEQKSNLHSELNHARNKYDTTQQEKLYLISKIDDLEELAKKTSIEYENERNKLTAEVDKVLKEKHKYELSLSVTRDIVEVLSMRLRESDNELDNLDAQLQQISYAKTSAEDELNTYKTTLNNTLVECHEYKEALVNILKSKASLAKEHNRIMEHNVTLIESLQNVEKEAYREISTIKEEMVEDVEAIKMESVSQIQKLREEVELKRALAVAATEQAGAAAAAAEHARTLLQQAARELDRLEQDNQLLQLQIHDQQSLAVEVSLLRQENEELTMTVAKQSSLIDKMKRDSEQVQSIQNKPKSPALHRKTHKVGKENASILVSPLRERNN